MRQLPGNISAREAFDGIQIGELVIDHGQRPSRLDRYAIFRGAALVALRDLVSLTLQLGNRLVCSRNQLRFPGALSL